MKRNRVLLSLLALSVLVVGQSASATFDHGPYLGPNVNFTFIGDTTQSSGFFGTPDPEPLLGPMSTLGDTLSWSPTQFHATSSGAAFPSNLDEDKSHLEIWMTALAPGALDLITISESGYVDLSGSSNLTNATITMSGTLEVTAGGSDYLFTFSEGGTPDVLAVFDVPTVLTADVSSGITYFNGTAVFDVVALLAGVSEFASATSAVLIWDDSLIVSNENGQTAHAYKTSVQVVVPEPTTGALLMGGLLALGIRARRSRV